ncbi:hypothetical protein T310_6101 [Rasamsonia emersonii CBS 393.64]|uniref:Uncharacterized protein n=1 Tax=Rasamsonia emersonii (strain ATCC 16479 / CBS 393.64 / IMI 116815) TaxID=1408163 RepID=A0A0F4YNQ8_RASE3|nr:hypothetical protein T310_6101 [Rasamsonia emersonii CBS 393.64]KKA19902.1 hypothetical protein T310_6101 [Rasamsonia emersonii CBS 393.64]
MALVLLQILRALVFSLRILRLPPPKMLESWIDGTERRIFRIIPSLMEWDANEPRKSMLSSGDEHALGVPRADRSSEHSPFDAPLDAVIAPIASSQPSTEPSRKIIERTGLRYHLQASRPRYPGNMSLTKSAVVLPTHTGITPRAINMSANLDGAPITLPAVPSYLSRMSYNSVSDSIYSSTSNGPVGCRHPMSTSSSLKGVAPAAARIYTDLLPKRPVFSFSSGLSSRPYSLHDKIRSSSNVQSGLTSLAGMDQFPSVPGTISSFPGNFPISDELEYSSLATVAQHVVRGHTRPLSAPMFQLESVESGGQAADNDDTE